MANPELTNGILRTDARGWVHTPAERREALLNEFEKSGMSGKKFNCYYFLSSRRTYLERTLATGLDRWTATAWAPT